MIPYGEGNIEISYGKLASLHERVMNCTHEVHMWRQYAQLPTQQLMFGNWSLTE
jgi:hypothetical protein